MHSLHEPVERLMRAVAADIIMPRFRRLAAHEISEKGPGDLVTIADRESELRLAEHLLTLLPGSRVAGEEAAAADPAILDDLGNGLIWVVDPLDGTLNFSEGKTPFAVMVALLADGVCQAGWILDPVSGRMCRAVHGGGTFVDGQRIAPPPASQRRPVAAIALHFLSPERRAEIEASAAGWLDLVAIPRCAGEQYPRLFLGENDLTLFERTMPWDHLAGALMLQEVGGKVARLDGSPYLAHVPGRGMIAAASPALWDYALPLLRPGASS